MIISTTDSIENSKITNYLGVVSGTDIYLVGGLLGGGLINQENLYTTAFNNAIDKMIQKAYRLGANAIIGVSTNTVSPGELNNIIVIVTGTAVIIQKNKTDNSADISTAPEEPFIDDPLDTDFEIPSSCPHCGEDLSFMGWTREDFKNTQACPVCGKKILIEK